MSIKTVTRTIALAACILAAGTAGAEERKLTPEMKAFEASLHKQTGDVSIPGAGAKLHLADRYYFIPAEEAKTVLTKAWGNPPQSAEGVLGLVFEKDATVFDNVWSAVVTFEDTGYVSDKDAQTQKYDEVIEKIRESEPAINKKRQEGGFSTIHIVGWAQPPSYDAASHSLIWARDLKISDSPVDALNYDVRLLGRRGVLSLNMLSDMNHLPQVRAAATDFGKAAAFDTGSAYADFDQSVDKTAGYGLAGLVAAGAGVVVAKKLGLIALLLPFGKWIIGGVLVAFAAIGRLFGRKSKEE